MFLLFKIKAVNADILSSKTVIIRASLKFLYYKRYNLNFYNLFYIIIIKIILKILNPYFKIILKFIRFY